MADLPNGEQQRRRSAFWLTTLTVLYLLTLMVWPVVFRFVSRVTAEYPGPVSPTLGGAFPVLLARAYPFMVVLGLVAAWSLYLRRLYSAALWVSLIPFANLLLMYLALSLLAQGYGLVSLSYSGRLQPRSSLLSLLFAFVKTGQGERRGYRLGLQGSGVKETRDREGTPGPEDNEYLRPGWWIGRRTIRRRRCR
jgi:hypothetical protein